MQYVSLVQRFRDGYKRADRDLTTQAAAAYAEKGDYEAAGRKLLPVDPSAANAYFGAGDRVEAKAARAKAAQTQEARTGFDRELLADPAAAEDEAKIVESARRFGLGYSDAAPLISAAKQLRATKSAEAMRQARESNMRLAVQLQEIDDIQDPRARQEAFYRFRKSAADQYGLDAIKSMPTEYTQGAYRVLMAQALTTEEWLKWNADERRGQRDDAKLGLEGRRVAALEARVAQGDSAGGGMSNAQFSRANTLRDEFVDQTKEARSVEALAVRSRDYVNAGVASPMQDIGLVYAYAKALDPASVVREAEFATMASAGGLGERFKNLVSQANGKGFTPTTRQELLNAIEAAAASLRKTRDERAVEYQRRAKQLGIDPSFVVDTQPPQGGVGSTPEAGGAARKYDAQGRPVK
jgi:hypothetical protein